MKIYTKNGDLGYSCLEDKTKIKKSDIIFEVLGTIDELSSNLGLVKAMDKEKEFYDILEDVQKKLCLIMANIACKEKEKYKIKDEDILKIEQTIDLLLKDKKEPFCFVLPGENEISARLDVSRCVARRAERVMVCAKENYDIDENLIKFLNRLSDLIYAMARK